ncbi:MAG: leucyl aminopeptidase, partial [Sphingomonadales bacterium 39-62-4]
MKVVFRTADAPLPRLVARLVAQDALPADLDAVVREGAAAARFTGKAGQTFEAFVAGEGGVKRLALTGIGKSDAEERTANLEKAGAALTAKYLTSGESALAIDFTGSGLTGAQAASVLFGARLRGWRHDVYRTKLTDEQKPSLTEIVAVAAPEGTAAAWEIESALAEGIEFTRELVAEPANVIYPESFVERAKARLEGTGVEVLVLGLKEMTDLGMGALLGVAQGSVREPKLLAMRWKGATVDKPTAFVGKGVTFDTGGISI